ncbi:MAG: D-2-hydroxyacid dehydrogenase [Microthrixaceae bacterium]
MGSSSPIVVGIMYPSWWYGSEDGFGEEVAALEAIDPRIEVVFPTYEEPHEVRTARGAPQADGAAPIEAQPIEPEDRELMARMHVALAIDVPPDITTIAPDLAWVQAVGSGTAQLQAAGLAPAGVTLTSNGGSNGVAIAEFVFGRLIEARKHFVDLAAAQADHEWKAIYGTQLSGQTLGLLGYGAINQAVAVRAAAFGMRVLVARRTPDAQPEPPVDECFGPDDLHEMLGRCDAVIAAVPETPETEAMMNADAFAAMRPGAFFANVGRGTLVDEAALVDALESGQVGSAAIDVAQVEPLPADHPLWEAPNLRISGHCSTAPSALFPNLHRTFRENLRRFVGGEALTNQVEAGRGY